MQCKEKQERERELLMEKSVSLRLDVENVRTFLGYENAPGVA